MGTTHTNKDIDLEPPEEERDELDERPPAAGPSGARAVPYARGVSGPGVLQIYKPGQGAHVRWATAIGAGILSVWTANFVYEQLGRFVFAESLVVRYLIPVLVLTGMAVLIFQYVGRNRRVVDFLIATEGEMKKVNWSTRREVFGATRVVIFTLIMLGTILFLVDVFFMAFFELIGVLRIRMFSQLLTRLFGGGDE